MQFTCLIKTFNRKRFLRCCWLAFSCIAQCETTSLSTLDRFLPVVVTQFHWVNKKNHSFIHSTRKHHTSVAFLCGFLKLYNSCKSSYSVFEKEKKRGRKWLVKRETKSTKPSFFRKRSFPYSSTADNNEHNSLSSGQATTLWIINTTVPFERQSPDIPLWLSKHVIEGKKW